MNSKAYCCVWVAFLFWFGGTNCTDTLGSPEPAKEPVASETEWPDQSHLPEPTKEPQQIDSIPGDASSSEPPWPDTIKPKPDTAAHEVTAEPQVPEVSPRRRTIKALTFNIRLGIAQDGENHWNKRKQMVFDVIKRVAPDFLGMQEAWKFQIDEILQAVPGYKCYGRSRKANTTLDEWSPLCYRYARWTLDATEQGVLWLSKTPEVPGSQSWGSSLPRIVTWARLIEKGTKRGFYVFNTHYDHRAQAARVESSKLISRRIAGRLKRDQPALLMGDFNAGETNDAIQYLEGKTLQGSKSFVPLIDTFRSRNPTARQVGTFHGWSGRKTGSKIDYIFVIKGWSGQKVIDAKIIYDNINGRYPSDHFPVSATISYAIP